MRMSAAEFVAVTDGYAFSLSEGSMDVKVGLMEGFETFPFGDAKDVRFFVDLSDATTPNDPTISDWSVGTYKGHQGTDYPASERSTVDMVAHFSPIPTPFGAKTTIRGPPAHKPPSMSRLGLSVITI